MAVKKDGELRQRMVIVAEMELLRAQGSPYEEVTAKRLELLENYTMTRDQVQRWYDDAVALEKTGTEYGLLYMVFYEMLSRDHTSSWFYTLVLQYYLYWIMNGPPDGFEDVELFQLDDIDVLFEDAFSVAFSDFTDSDELSQLYLKYWWFRSDRTIKGLFDTPEGDATSSIDEIALAKVQVFFQRRLETPHAQLDETFALVSRFVSANFPKSYAELMPQYSATYQRTKRIQEPLELVFTKWKSPETEEHWIQFMQEVATCLPKKSRDSRIICHVFENAISSSKSLSLWSQFVLLLLEQDPHRATKLLWRFIRTHSSHIPAYVDLICCGGLSRADHQYNDVFNMALIHGLLADPTERHWSDLAVAFLSAGMSFDDVSVSPSSLLDQSFSIEDPFHSVARFVANLYEIDNQNIKDARAVHERLKRTFPSEAENWLISYNFERRAGDMKAAKSVLVAAVNRAELLDWPERIFEELLRFVQLYHRDEYPAIKTRIERKRKEVEKLREEQATVPNLEELEISHKRTADEMSDDQVSKEPTKKKEIVRDREHLTVAVRGLPLGARERNVTRFFKDCGTIREMKLVTLEDSVQANVEFTDEKEVLRALTKDYKTISGVEVRVQRLEQNTLFVANFPTSYTQAQIQDLFSSIGPVASVRLPSLKFNTQRRFAYIEYTQPSNAQSAVGLLNGKDINGHILSVQISDPSAKQNRSGANEEGRELYITKLDFFKVTSNKVKQLFEKYGTVESVHLPLSERNKSMNRKHDGYGFVVFSTPAEAQAALALNMVTLEGRAIEVSISEKKAVRSKKMENRALKDYFNADNVIAVKNVPDTVNVTQLKHFFGTIGELENVILEPAHGGAIIVFKNEQIAGTAALTAEGKTIGDYRVEVTTVKDLKRIDVDKSTATPTMLAPSSVRRRKMVQAVPSSEPSTGSHQQTDRTAATGNTNADFRAMLFGKK